MCGITAYNGTRRASGILLEALRKLEYRGYDSAGVATLHDGKIEARRGVGKVDAVDRNVRFEELEGTIGIAHTRWATTGSVTVPNAHPHVSPDGTLALAHNGIVENYEDLREELIAKGRKFSSETDTEVVLALIEERMAAGDDLLHAARGAFARMHGRSAFVALDARTGTIVAARKGSPLILGIAKDGIFLASDAAPLLEHTRDVVFIEDDEIVEISGRHARGYALYGAKDLAPRERAASRITWTLEQAQKGEYAHFMLKEIMEQRHTIAQALAQDRKLVMQVAREIDKAFGTYVVGCGSAGKVALAATYAFSSIAGRHLNFALGSEFPNHHGFLTDRSLLVAISQSGETADTLEAIEVAKAKGGRIVSVVNVIGSTMDRTADHTLPVHAGPEKAVCSTKATTGQLAIMTLLAYACAGKYEEGVERLRETSDAIGTMLTPERLRHVEKVAHSLKDAQDIYIIGRGASYPIALESAIKIQEVSYIHAEGFAGGELKHGPIALIAPGTPLIVLAPNDATREDVLTNALEVKARGGRIIGIAPRRSRAFDEWIETPDLPETAGIVSLVPVQLLAYYLAVAKGNDVDMPRNLAKSVTVK